MEIKMRRDVLQAHILRSNQSQNGFARKARVSSGYLTQLLAGKRHPSGPVREKLMDASRLRFDDLFVIVAEMPPGSVGDRGGEPEAAHA